MSETRNRPVLVCAEVDPTLAPEVDSSIQSLLDLPRRATGTRAKSRRRTAVRRLPLYLLIAVAERVYLSVLRRITLLGPPEPGSYRAGASDILHTVSNELDERASEAFTSLVNVLSVGLETGDVVAFAAAARMWREWPPVFQRYWLCMSSLGNVCDDDGIPGDCEAIEFLDAARELRAEERRAKRGQRSSDRGR